MSHQSNSTTSSGNGPNSQQNNSPSSMPGYNGPMYQQPHTSGLPFAGSKISLISKNGIRYEGTLHNIDTAQSQVALRDVTMFGSEGRREGKQIPKSDRVFEFIVFKNSDIQDLTVCSTPQPPFQGMSHPYANPYFNPYGMGMPQFPQQGQMPQFMQQQGNFGQIPPMFMPMQQQPTPSEQSTETGQTEEKQAPPTTTAAPSKNEVEKPTPTQDKPVPEKTSTKGEANNSKSLNFQQDFDIEASNRALNKEDDKKKALEENLPEVKPVYNKKSFFDQTQPDEKSRYNPQAAYKTDVETFGQTAIDQHRHQFRGGHRGRGGGSRGSYHRGRGHRRGSYHRGRGRGRRSAPQDS